MDALIASLGHPSEVYALLRYKYILSDKTLYKNVQELPPLGDSKYSYALCYYYLNKTSRSFARVIQELDVELQHPVCLFYLILRGLDTIEDDMTLDLNLKLDLLRSFHEIIYKKGWNFDGNGPQEKDRILLVQFDVVIDEFLKLKPACVFSQLCLYFYSYQKTITDITKRMGHGMAEFCAGKKVKSLEDYNLYTHYVAGLVGLGLTGLFVDSGLEDPSLSKNVDLPNHMGLFLQKVNILKDYLTDLEEGRLFWPSDVWELYVPQGQSVDAFSKPEHLDRALACLNHLCADALELVPDTLTYLSQLKNQTVFQFAAIPQVMALATFDHFYNNPSLFQKKGNKIRRGLAVELILASTDMESLKQIYYEYALGINKKNRMALGRNPHDKTFMRMSSACSNIVKWILEDDAKLGRPIRKNRMDSGQKMVGYVMLLALILLLMSSFPGVN